jgi:hypothetical protein
MLNKAIEWFIWGICMGMGWAISTNVLNFIGGFMHGAH